MQFTFTYRDEVFSVERAAPKDGLFGYKATAYGETFILYSDVELFAEYEKDECAWSQHIEEEMLDNGLLTCNDDLEYIPTRDIKTQYRNFREFN